MRKNLPVSQCEFPLPPHTTLMSTTDIHGNVTYANEAFIAVSGYSREELLGQPHNIVRHPDMPAAAFADMWATLRENQSWTGIVKNRRKNGDHYWVRANAAPMIRDGEVVGYISVRTNPLPQEVKAADQLYRRLQQDRAGSVTLRRGSVLRRGAWAWSTLRKQLGLAVSVPVMLLCALALSLMAGWLLGMSDSDVLRMALSNLLLIAFAWALLQFHLVAPLATIVRHAKALASGQPLPGRDFDRIDEVGMLMRAINQSGLNLTALIDDIALRCGIVGSSSQQISAGNWDLAGRTASQASALIQSAASVGQLHATVQQNAQNAVDANQLIKEVCTLAAEGGKAMGRVEGTMGRIQEASAKMSEIVGVIDAIAFQTNILALNAAVEAARAGHQGRGFAVVASEVRALASRSALAAKEIAQLIANNVEHVKGGSVLVEQAGGTVKEVVAGIEHIAEFMAGITHASHEQAQGVGQVNQAIAVLDKATQQNTGLVESCATSADQLKEQAALLLSAVRVFGSNSAPRLRQAQGGTRQPWRPLRVAA